MASIIGGKGMAWKGASVITEALKAFFVSRGSADRDLSLDRETLMLRSRALFQNSAFAGALIESFDTNVVGTGIKARPAINYELLGISRESAEEWERRTQNLFELWATSKSADAERKNDFYQLQALAIKTQLICGDCFALPLYKTGTDSPFGFRIKLLEGDRCRNPYGLADTDTLSGGVEVDRNGAPTFYHFTERIPYSIDNYTDCIPTIRVPAFDAFGNPNVIHIFTSDRTDQRRGIPILAPIVSQIKQQERYQDAELMAAVVSSMFTVFIKSAGDASEDFYGNVANGQRVEPVLPKSAAELSPGGIVELANGESIEVADPKRPNANYDPFVSSIFTEAAARCGISAEVVLRKFNSSYNAVRAAILESKKTFNRVKRNFISDFARPVYERWLSEAVMIGLVEAPGYFEDPLRRFLWNGCRWISDAAFLLDPQKETQAIKMQLDEQLIDRDTACSMISGGEYERTAIKLSEEKRLRAEIGLQEPGTINKTESFSVSTQDTSESDL